MNKSTTFVRAGESVSRQCPNLFMFADGRELVSAQYLLRIIFIEAMRTRLESFCSILNMRSRQR
jgi:hypothetical protein